jgi:hypothetical protein
MKMRGKSDKRKRTEHVNTSVNLTPRTSPSLPYGEGPGGGHIMLETGGGGDKVFGVPISPAKIPMTLHLVR